MWFDVGIEEYTTARPMTRNILSLWFDVGIEEYTTSNGFTHISKALWFDVGIEEYTTVAKEYRKIYDEIKTEYDFSYHPVWMIIWQHLTIKRLSKKSVLFINNKKYA